MKNILDAHGTRPLIRMKNSLLTTQSLLPTTQNSPLTTLFR